MEREQEKIAQIRRSWLSRGFSCDLWVDPPGQVWADFVHPTDELLVVLTGQIEIEMQGRKIHPAIGEEVLIPANTPHTVRNIGDSRARWLYGYR